MQNSFSIGPATGPWATGNTHYSINCMVSSGLLFFGLAARSPRRLFAFLFRPPDSVTFPLSPFRLAVRRPRCVIIAN